MKKSIFGTILLSYLVVPLAQASDDDAKWVNPYSAKVGLRSKCGGDNRLECNPPLKAWYEDVGARILQALQAEPNATAFTNKNPTHCAFTIDETGKISDLKIVQSSNSADVDRLALHIIEKSVPFKVFPPAKKMVVWFYKYPDFIYSFDVDPVGNKQKLRQQPKTRLGKK